MHRILSSFPKAALAIIVSSHSFAATIDFEQVQPVTQDVPLAISTISVSGVTVDFSCGGSSCAVFAFGGAVNGFSRDADNQEIPTGGFGPGTRVGSQALTDQVFIGPGNPETNPFEISFSKPVLDVSLDVIDSEGGPIILRSFGSGGLSGTPIFETTVPALADASVVNLTFAGASITAISLTPQTQDPGIAIDNVSFTVVPLPSPLLLMSFSVAALGLAGVRARYRMPRQVGM